MKRIVIIIIIILVSVVLARNAITKTIISSGIKAITGLKLSIRGVKVGIIKTSIDIKELKLYNPVGFADKLMIDIPQIYVDYDLGAFFKRRVHLEELKLNLKELVVVKNEEGQINLHSLKVVKTKEKEPQKKKKTKASKFQIDVLELKVDKVIYKDYSKGSQPSIREFQVNIDERYENITNPKAFVRLIVVKALMKTTLASLANFNLTPLKDAAAITLKKSGRLAVDTAGKAVEVGKEVGKETTEALGEAVDKTADTIKKILPLGK